MQLNPNRNKTNRTMKPQFKHEEIYLDLSKLSEEQQRNITANGSGITEGGALNHQSL